MEYNLGMIQKGVIPIPVAETTALASLINDWKEFYTRDMKTLRHLLIITDRMFQAMENSLPQYSREPDFSHKAPDLIKECEKLGSLLEDIIRVTSNGNPWQRILITPRAKRARRSLNSALFILEAFFRDANHSPDQALTTEDVLAVL